MRSEEHAGPRGLSGPRQCGQQAGAGSATGLLEDKALRGQCGSRKGRPLSAAAGVAGCGRPAAGSYPAWGAGPPGLSPSPATWASGSWAQGGGRPCRQEGRLLLVPGGARPADPAHPPAPEFLSSSHVLDTSTARTRAAGSAPLVRHCAAGLSGLAPHVGRRPLPEGPTGVDGPRGTLGRSGSRRAGGRSMRGVCKGGAGRARPGGRGSGPRDAAGEAFACRPQRALRLAPQRPACVDRGVCAGIQPELEPDGRKPTALQPRHHRLGPPDRGPAKGRSRGPRGTSGKGWGDKDRDLMGPEGLESQLIGGIYLPWGPEWGWLGQRTRGRQVHWEGLSQSLDR